MSDELMTEDNTSFLDAEYDDEETGEKTEETAAPDEIFLHMAGVLEGLYLLAEPLNELAVSV